MSSSHVRLSIDCSSKKKKNVGQNKHTDIKSKRETSTKEHLIFSLLVQRVRDDQKVLTRRYDPTWKNWRRIEVKIMKRFDRKMMWVKRRKHFNRIFSFLNYFELDKYISVCIHPVFVWTWNLSLNRNASPLLVNKSFSFPLSLSSCYIFSSSSSSSEEEEENENELISSSSSFPHHHRSIHFLSPLFFHIKLRTTKKANK